MSGYIHFADQHVSQDEIRHRARKVATGFDAMNVQKGSTIAILMRNDIDFFTLVLGADMVGAVATPINWHLTASEADYILKDCGALILVAHSDLWHSIEANLSSELKERLQVLLVRTPDVIQRSFSIEQTVCDIRAGEQDFLVWLEEYDAKEGEFPVLQAGMIYTSGTTGYPKGVLRLGPVGVTKRGNYNAFMEGMVFLLAAPLYHAAPFRIAMSVFRLGGDVVLEARFDCRQTLELVEHYGVTHSFMVPTMFIRLLKMPKDERDRYDVSSLVHVVHAGAPCPVEVKMEMISWWGPVLYEYYGGTESGAVTYCNSEDYLAHPGTVGRAVPDATIRIMDERGDEVGVNEPGEIFCRLHSLPDFTYHRREDERLAMERDGLISLGDIGYLTEEGYLFITDRKRDMVISGGVNIYPAMVEAPFLSHSDVLDCAAFGIPDPDLGESLVIAVELTANAMMDERSLLDFVRPRLAKYQVPRRIFFTQHLPRDAAGKIQKRKLRAPFWETGDGQPMLAR